MTDGDHHSAHSHNVGCINATMLMHAYSLICRVMKVKAPTWSAAWLLCAAIGRGHPELCAESGVSGSRVLPLRYDRHRPVGGAARRRPSLQGLPESEPHRIRAGACCPLSDTRHCLRLRGLLLTSVQLRDSFASITDLMYVPKSVRDVRVAHDPSRCLSSPRSACAQQPFYWMAHDGQAATVILARMMRNGRC